MKLLYLPCPTYLPSPSFPPEKSGTEVKVSTLHPKCKEAAESGASPALQHGPNNAGHAFHPRTSKSLKVLAYESGAGLGK